MGKKTFFIIAGVLIAGILLISYLTDLRNIKKKRQNELTENVSAKDPLQPVKPVDPETGLVIGPGFNLVKTNCLGCHSSKLMQKTQNLWDLGENEPIILDYLARYYAPGKVGRRSPLTTIEWYELQE